MPLAILAETPNAGPLGHRFLASPGAALDAVQAASAVREVSAAPDGVGRGCLGATRSTVQAATGRPAAEVVALVGLDPFRLAALSRAARDEIRGRLRRRLAELDAVAAGVAWAVVPGGVVSAPALAAWIEPAWHALAAAPATTEGPPRPPRRWVKPFVAVSATAVSAMGVLAAAVFLLTDSGNGGPSPTSTKGAAATPDGRAAELMRTRVQALIKDHGGDPHVILETVRRNGTPLTQAEKEELATDVHANWAPRTILNLERSRQWSDARGAANKLAGQFAGDVRFSALTKSIDNNKAVYESYCGLRGECSGQNPSEGQLLGIKTWVGDLKTALKAAPSGRMRDNASAQADAVEKWLNSLDVIDPGSAEALKTRAGVVCPKLASTDELFWVPVPLPRTPQ